MWSMSSIHYKNLYHREEEEDDTRHDIDGLMDWLVDVLISIPLPCW